MDKKNVKEEEANKIVAQAYATFSDIQVDNIQCFWNGQEAFYHVYATQFYQGVAQSILIPLNQEQYFGLLKYGLKLKGYEVKSIKPVLRKGSITYQVMNNVYSLARRKK